METTAPISSALKSKRPRAADNAQMHSILSAAIGLSSLSDSPPAWKSPSLAASVPTSDESLKLANHPQDHALDRESLKHSTELKQAIKDQIMKTMAATMPRAAPMAAVGSAPPTVSAGFLSRSYLKLKNPSSYRHLSDYHLPASLASRPHEAPLANYDLASIAEGRDLLARADRLAAMDRSSLVPASLQEPLPSSKVAAYSQKPLPQSLPTPNELPTSAATKTFPEILFSILSDEEHANIIAWLPHGKGFVINDKDEFSNIILPLFFDGAKFTSFTRRLKRWNFVRVPRGPEMGAYYNKSFTRDDSEEVSRMKYKKESVFEGHKMTEEKKRKDDMDIDMLEELTKKEVEAKVQQSLLKDEEKAEQVHRMQQRLLLDREEPGTKSAEMKPESFISGVAPPMPLPSSLPRRTYKGAKVGTIDATDIKTASFTNLQEYPTLSRSGLSSDSLKSTLTTQSDLPLSQYPSTLLSASTSNDQRLKEIEAELFLLRSQSSSLRNASAAMYGGMYTQPSRYQAPSALSSQNIINAEYEQVVSEANRQLSGSGRYHRIAAASMAPAPAVHNLQSRSVPSFDRPPQVISSSIDYYTQAAKVSRDYVDAQEQVGESSPNLSGRSVMMTRQEEEEFAQYLLMKKDLEALRSMRETK